MIRLAKQVRIVTLQDVSLTDAGKDNINHYLGRKNQIATVLGEDVWDAVQTSQKWAQDSDEILTSCIVGYAFPGHAMVVRVTVNYEECVKYANAAYGS